MSDDKPIKLPPTSTRILLAAPMGLEEVRVPHPVARTFCDRGWGDMIGNKTSRTFQSFPDARLRYNAAGRAAAAKLYRQRLSEEERERYDGSYRDTSRQVAEMVRDQTVEELIEEAVALKQALENGGHVAASVAGHLHALVAYRDTRDQLHTPLEDLVRA